MKKNNLVKEVGLILILIVVLLIPIFIFINNDNKNKAYENLNKKIIAATETYVKTQNFQNNNSTKVNLTTLKNSNILNEMLVNPKTKKAISNESYVIVSKNSNGFNYDVKLFDIPKEEDTAGLIVSYNGDRKMQNGIAVRYEELGINIFDGDVQLNYSTQYFLNGKEVKVIDTSRPRDYEVVYTAINRNGELAKIVRTVIVQ